MRNILGLRKNKKFILGICLLLIVGLFTYRQFGSPAEKKINKTKVISGTLQEKMTISGVIDADERVILRFPASGKLAWVGVKEGDYVKKYQTIATLDQVALKKTLEKELNDYLSARADLDQATRDTYNNQVITDPIKRIIDKYQYTMNKSVLDLELQNLSIEYANLWTPIEGLVTRVTSPYSGVNITPAQVEFEIINPKTIYFAATADQSEVIKLQESLSGELTLDSYPDTTLSGTIKKISFVPKSGETATEYEVKFIFPQDNQDYKYRIGMSGDLTFVTKEKKDILYVPAKFIVSQNGKKYLKVTRNGQEEKTEVKIGMETDANTEITSGIAAGETIHD